MERSLEEILHAEQQLQQAMLKNDVPTLEHLLHENLIFTDQTGNVLGKEDDITSHTSNVLHFSELEFIESPVVQFHGEVAIVAVKAQIKGTFQETPFEALYRFLRVWLFQEGHWQIIAANISTIG